MIFELGGTQCTIERLISPGFGLKVWDFIRFPTAGLRCSACFGAQLRGPLDPALEAATGVMGVLITLQGSWKPSRVLSNGLVLISVIKKLEFYGILLQASSM